MKRLPLVLIVAALGAGPAAQVAAWDLAEMKTKGTLRVLVSGDETSAKPGAGPGMEQEMIEAFARLHHLEVKFVPVKRWGDIIPALLRGEGDLILGINDTEERRRQLDFTAEVIPSRHLAVTRAPDSAIVTMDALRAARVGVVSGTTWAKAASAAGVPESRTVPFPNTTTMLEGLRTQKVSAVVMALADLFEAAEDDPTLQAGMFLGPSGHAAWAVRKTDPELRHALDAHLQSSRATGAWSRLVVKYYGKNALEVLDRARIE